MTPPRLLLLGGTAEAAALARELAIAFGPALDVTTSLAGRTRRPNPVPGALRTGGFGGAAGLGDFLRDRAIDAVIDATHPFSATISANAVAACAAADRPRLVLARPPWQSGAGDRWIEAASPQAAAAALPRYGRRVFLSVGARDHHWFAALDDMWFLVRLMEPPAPPLALADCHLVVDRGPFTPAGERALLREHAIDVVVTKASGGAATRSKLDAARALGLPVVMVARPPPPPGPSVATVAAAQRWVTATLGITAVTAGNDAGEC